MLAERATARAQLASLKAEFAGFKVRRRRSHVDDLDSTNRSVVQAFDDAPPQMRVMILQELIEVILLHPSSMKKRKNDPSRVEVIFAQPCRTKSAASGAGATMVEQAAAAT